MSECSSLCSLGDTASMGLGAAASVALIVSPTCKPQRAANFVGLFDNLAHTGSLINALVFMSGAFRQPACLIVRITVSWRATVDVWKSNHSIYSVRVRRRMEAGDGLSHSRSVADIERGWTTACQSQHLCGLEGARTRGGHTITRRHVCRLGISRFEGSGRLVSSPRPSRFWSSPSCDVRHLLLLAIASHSQKNIEYRAGVADGLLRGIAGILEVTCR